VAHSGAPLRDPVLYLVVLGLVGASSLMATEQPWTCLAAWATTAIYLMIRYRRWLASVKMPSLPRIHPVVLFVVGFSLIFFGTTHVLSEYSTLFAHESEAARAAREFRAGIVGGSAISLGALIFIAWWLASRRWAVEDKG